MDAPITQTYTDGLRCQFYVSTLPLSRFNIEYAHATEPSHTDWQPLKQISHSGTSRRSYSASPAPASARRPTLCGSAFVQSDGTLEFSAEA